MIDFRDPSQRDLVTDVGRGLARYRPHFGSITVMLTAVGGASTVLHMPCTASICSCKGVRALDPTEKTGTYFYI